MYDDLSYDGAAFGITSDESRTTLLDAEQEDRIEQEHDSLDD